MDVGQVNSPALATPRSTLGVTEAVAITVGIVVGAGIFRIPPIVAGLAASEAAILWAWLAGGAVSIVGALCYAELAATYPHAGGDYHFLARAFGKRLAFLYGWARLSVIQTGSIAILAYVFGDYAAQLLDIGPASSGIYAAALVVVLTAVNWIGVRSGTRTQNLLTILEVLGLATVVVAGLIVAPEAAAAAPPPASATAFGSIMVLVLLTFGGWNEAVYMSAELKDAPRRMAPVLILSLLLITLLYVGANAAYLRALGHAGLAESKAVGADVMGLAFGPAGAILMSALIAVAALTSANATMFTGARTAYALGCDFRRLSFLGCWTAKSDTPGNALLVQGAAALALVIAGFAVRDGFELAVDYTAPVFWLFFLLVGIALFVLRRRDPDRPRPFKVPLYPVLPLIFCATNAYLLYSSVVFRGVGALVGVGVLAVGVLLLLLLPLRETQEETTR